MKNHISPLHDNEGRFLHEVVTNLGLGHRGPKERRPGSAMINVAVVLLFALAIGLYAVSLIGQYRWLTGERHNDAVSWVEALALDGGMSIFSLLALGLARAGQSARAERSMIILCALGSAGMNLAAATDTSPRSVLAFIMPPLFLALVVDRVVSVVRRHYLGDADQRSVWAAGSKVALYALRLVLAPPSTVTGARRAVLAATPVPEAPARPVPSITSMPPVSIMPPPAPVQRQQRRGGGTRTGTKQDALVSLVVVRHGPLEQLPLERCSKIATALAPEVPMHAAAARTALLKRVRAAQDVPTRAEPEEEAAS
jgi:hypothetical protein